MNILFLGQLLFQFDIGVRIQNPARALVSSVSGKTVSVFTVLAILWQNSKFNIYNAPILQYLKIKIPHTGDKESLDRCGYPKDPRIVPYQKSESFNAIL